MSKKAKFVVGILVGLILVIAAYMGYTLLSDSDKKENVKEVVATNVIDNKELEINVITNNVIEENKIEENKIEENVIANNVIEENKVSENKKQEAQDTELKANTDEEKAIAIVKKDWGLTDGFYFKAQPNSDGTYDVSVSDENTAVLAWYTVNPKTGKFTK